MHKSELINHLQNQMNLSGYSYLAHLAATGQEKMVEQWIKKSPTASYQAIYGSATVGKIERIHELIGTCADQNKALKMAVRGLVRGNHLDDLYKIKNYNAFKEDIVLGYAQAGNQELVGTMVDRDPAHLFEAAIKGFASAGHAKPLLDLVKGTRFYGEAIYQAAKAGHVNLVNQLLAECGFTENMVLNTPTTNESIHLFGLLNKALSGYCNGYHLQHAAHLLTKGADIQTALDELKSSGEPCLDAYIGLLITTPTAKSQALLEQIQRELSVESTNLSASQVANIKKLQEEYHSKSCLSLVEFLTDLPSVEGLNEFKQLDSYFGDCPASPSPSM